MKKLKTIVPAASSAKSVKPAAAATKPAVASKPAAAPKLAVAAKPVLAVKRPSGSGPQPTVISANIDVGFGNTLYIRGEGPGLSWERGRPMDCVKDDIWSFSIEAAARTIVFKFLTNDETWCTGDDYVVEPGKKITLVPSF